MLGEFLKKDFLRPPLALYLARDIFLPLDLFSPSKARSQEREGGEKGLLGRREGEVQFRDPEFNGRSPLM